MRILFLSVRPLVAACLAGATVAGAAAGPAHSSSWSDPVEMTAPGSTASGEVEVQANERGEVLAAWTDYREVRPDDYEGVVRVTTSDAQGRFAPIQDLADPAPAVSLFGMAINARGEAVIAWSDLTDRLFTAVRRPGGRFGPPQQIVGARADWVWGGDLALDDAGNAILVWSQYLTGENRYEVRAALRPAGRAWEAPRTLSHPDESSEGPRIAMGGDGTAVATWSRVTDDQGCYLLYAVQGATRPAQGWFAPARDISPEGERSWGPDVAFDGEDGVATWLADGPQGLVVRAAVAEDAVAFGSPITLTAGRRIANGDPPLLASDRTGHTLVVWTGQEAGTPGVIEASERQGDGPFGAPRAVAGLGDWYYAGSVALAGDGRAIVGIFRPSDDPDRGVGGAAVRGSADEWFGPGEDVSRAPRGASTPSVAIDAQGNATAAWQGYQPGDRRQAWATLARRGPFTPPPLPQPPIVDPGPPGPYAGGPVGGGPSGSEPSGTVTGLRMSPRRPRPRGRAALRFSLSRPATVTLAIERRRERVGRRRPPVFARIGVVTRPAAAGANRIALPWRIRRRMVAGRYRAVLRVGAAATPGSQVRSLGFRVGARRAAAAASRC